jgi:glucose-1-phosphate cytidylyltransferase
MIEIGSQPIIWHIMKIYSHFGFNDFLICAGYKQYSIKEYFADYYLRSNDVTFDFSKDGSPQIIKQGAEPWRVTIVDTGLETMTGGRIKRVQSHIGKESFMLTYGDGIADVNIPELIAHHQRNRKIATLTGVRTTQRFGVLDIDNTDRVVSFREKHRVDSGLINGGFMVLEPEIFDYLTDDTTVFEQEPLERLSAEGELMVYRHAGFWQCMDTQRDKQTLEELWRSGKAPWKLW